MLAAPIDVNAIVRRTMQVLSPLEVSGVQLEMKLGEDLPQDRHSL